MKSIAWRKHEVALYTWKGSVLAFDAYMKIFNFSLHGMLRKNDVMDLAVQANVEAIRRAQFGGLFES